MSKHIRWAAVGAFFIALVMSFLIFGRSQSPQDLRAAYLPGGEFTLSHGGEQFDMESLRGSPYLLYFGFTHCPDVCPTGLITIKDALNADDAFESVRALFVTVDPDRDTAERMEEYARFFHPNIVGKTGTLEEIRALTKAYGTYFMAAKAGDDESYSVDHTAYFYLIDDDGRLARVLDHNVNALTIAEELRKLL